MYKLHFGINIRFPEISRLFLMSPLLLNCSLYNKQHVQAENLLHIWSNMQVNLSFLGRLRAAKMKFMRWLLKSFWIAQFAATDNIGYNIFSTHHCCWGIKKARSTKYKPSQTSTGWQHWQVGREKWEVNRGYQYTYQQVYRLTARKEKAIEARVDTGGTGRWMGGS